MKYSKTRLYRRNLRDKKLREYCEIKIRSAMILLMKEERPIENKGILL